MPMETNIFLKTRPHLGFKLGCQCPFNNAPVSEYTDIVRQHNIFATFILLSLTLWFTTYYCLILLFLPKQCFLAVRDEKLY